jgi:hypothetical protein
LQSAFAGCWHFRQKKGWTQLHSLNLRQAVGLPSDYCFFRKRFPVISFGWAMPSMSSRVGEMPGKSYFLGLRGI